MSNPVLAGLCIVAIGAALVGHSSWRLWRRRESRAWPAVAGVVASSFLEPDEDGRNRLVIECVYVVGGVTRRRRKTLLGGLFLVEPSAKHLQTVYHTGAQVKVRYLPGNPDTIELEYENSLGEWIGLVLGFLLMAVGANVGLIPPVS